MRRDPSCRPGRLVDFMEEETKVRKNLSRLIHTVQHMPSARYHKDASSLWNLVGELESFQPSSSSRPPNCARKAERKSFSRKYLDLRLYPSRDRSSSPESNVKCHKEDNKHQTFPSNKSKKNRNTEMKEKESEMDQNVDTDANTCQNRKPFSKTKYDRSKNCKENVFPESGKDKRRGCTEVQANSELKGPHIKPRAKLQHFQLRRKSEGANIPRPNNSPEQKNKEKANLCSNKDKSLLANDEKRFKHNVLDKLKALTNLDYIKEKCIPHDQFNLGLDKAFADGNILENDQASMVKKLTSYWNNLLNNEVDENEASSSQEGFDVPVINRSLQDLARSIYHTARDRKRRVSLSDHRSDSNVNIHKEFDSCNDSLDVLKSQKHNKDQFLDCLNEILSNGEKSNSKPRKCFNSKEESLSGESVKLTNPYLLEMGYDKSCGDNKNIQEIYTCKVQERVKRNFDLKAEHAIEVMENLVRKLKRFSELPLTSDEITLSHSLRTMLCLMTATVLSSTEQVFDGNLEPGDVVEVTGHDDADIRPDVNLRVASGFRELREEPSTERSNPTENCNTCGRSDNLQLVAVRGITLRKVEDALRYLTICKDYLWTEFLLSPRFHEEAWYSQDKHSPRSFTFVIEEEILFEEVCDEDECPSEDESEDEEDERAMGEACRSLCDSISISVERLVEVAADLVLHHWPDTFEGFVRTVYQTMVSLLVWWVITKEIFCK